MNLFWLDTDPTLAAQAHHDVHVRKMLLEGVQLLCTAFEEPQGQSFRDAQVAGLSVLAAHEAAHPGITRHVNPLYIRQATADNLFAWPWLV